MRDKNKTALVRVRHDLLSSAIANHFMHDEIEIIIEMVISLLRGKVLAKFVSHCVLLARFQVGLSCLSESAAVLLGKP